MSYPLVGQIATSFTNGLLGTNYKVPGNGNIPVFGKAGSILGGVASKSLSTAKEVAPVLTDRVNTAIGKGVSSSMNSFFGSNITPSPSSLTAKSVSSAPSVSSGASLIPGDGGVTVAVPDYLYADLAKAYGMDATTAYQEALSNTSYRRAMVDLKSAGLNPILAASGLSGASGVSYANPLPQSDSVASVSGSGISTGTSSGKSLHRWYKIFTSVGTIAGAAFGHPIIGASVGSAIGNLLDLASD